MNSVIWIVLAVLVGVAVLFIGRISDPDKRERRRLEGALARAKAQATVASDDLDELDSWRNPALCRDARRDRSSLERDITALEQQLRTKFGHAVVS